VLEDASVVSDYDFSNIQTLVDVGGGHGKLLTDVLKTYPKMKGILFTIGMMNGRLPKGQCAERNRHSQALSRSNAKTGQAIDCRASHSIR
jgi:hypothetical protein